MRGISAIRSGRPVRWGRREVGRRRQAVYFRVDVTGEGHPRLPAGRGKARMMRPWAS